MAHEPLTGGFVRFLEILPGSDPTLQCRLRAAHIRVCRAQYDALSYKNDGSGPQEHLICNGLAVSVGQNLIRMLERLRLPDRSRLVWVAHLCINMDDVHERARHVKLGVTIFQNARQVIVWLGLETMNDSGVVFSSICKVVNVWRKRSGLENRIPKATFSSLPDTTGMSPNTSQEASEPKLTEAWTSAISLFSHPWFCSVWSIAEVSIARSVVLMRGNKVISWDWIGLAAAVLRENYAKPRWTGDLAWTGGRRPPVDTGILTAYFMYRMSVSQSHFEPLKVTFHQLLRFSRHMTCQFRQDRIYALIGVPTVDADVVSSRIVVDYRKPSAQVNLETALLAMRGDCSPNLLANVRQDHDSRLLIPGGRYPKNLVLTGPSWCPQWDSPPTEVILPPWPCKEYHASEPSYTRLQITPDGRRLTSVGVFVDEVASENCFTEFHFWRGGDMDTRSKSRESQLHEAGITAGDLRDLALTLTCGKGWDGCPVSDIDRHVADYARCLMKDGLWWSMAWMRSIKGQRGVGPHQNAHGHGPILTATDLETISSGGHADRFLDCVASVGHGRAYFQTRQGHWGIGPDAMVEGDRLCSLHGAMVPFILRPRHDGTYHVVGECYVLEMMQGELQRSIMRRPCSQVNDAEVRIDMV